MTDLWGTKTQPLTFYNLIILLIVSLGSIAYGWANSIIATTLAQPSFIEYFHLDTAPNGTDLISTMNGLYQTGGFFGSMLLPIVADRYGRKIALAVPAAIVMVSGALLAGSVHVAMFIVFRFFSGFGSYMLLTAVSLYMSEVSPPSLRGGLMEINAVGYQTGYILASWTGLGFYFWKSENENEWRPPLAITCFWTLIFLLGLLYIPESPRYLTFKDRIDEAMAVLERLHGSGENGRAFARAELYQIRKQVAIDRTLFDSWIEVFRRPSYRKRALFVIGTICICQCSGSLVINNYGPTLYRGLGFSTVHQLLYQCGWITMSIGLVVISGLIIDKFPRPRFMVYGLIICMSCLIIEAAIIANFGKSSNHAALQAGVAMLFIYQIGLCIFLDGILFTYVAELFPTHLRAKGTSLGLATFCVMNIMWLQSAPSAFEAIGWKFYLCFIIPGCLGAFVIWFTFPDTNGLPLEEVAALFGDRDEVAVYQQEIEVDKNTLVVIDHSHEERMKETAVGTMAAHSEIATT